jgi:IclR family transcriptional regulator, KDG regulon repressor
MASASKRDNGSGVQAVIFAVEILRHLSSQRGPVGVSTLARDLRTTKNRIFRHLRTLVDLGYIVQDTQSDKYSVGPELMVLGRAVCETFDLVGASRDVLRELRDRLGHTAVVSAIEAEGIRVLYSMPGTSELEISLRPGALLRFHSTAQGKIALAFGNEELRKRVLNSSLVPRTPHTLTKPAALRKECAVVRERGWATAPNQGILGMNVLAAPIRDVTGTVCGTVAILDAIHFIHSQPSAKQIKSLLGAAQRISEKMGYVA